jgi:hypothetical protein
MSLFKKILIWVAIIAVVGGGIALSVFLAKKPANADTDKTNDAPQQVEARTFAKTYSAENSSYSYDYEYYTSHQFNPTMVLEPFDTITFDVATDKDKFYSYGEGSAAHMSNNGSVTLYDTTGQVRLQYSLSVYEETDTQVELSASLTVSINNSVIQYSRSISDKIVNYADTATIVFDHEKISLVYGDEVIELPLETKISTGATLSSASAGYSSATTATGDFFDVTVVY